MNPTGIRRRIRVTWCTSFWAANTHRYITPAQPKLSQATLVSVKAGDEVQADVFMQRIKTAEVAGHVIGRSGPAKLCR